MLQSSSSHTLSFDRTRLEVFVVNVFACHTRHFSFSLPESLPKRLLVESSVHSPKMKLSTSHVLLYEPKDDDHPREAALESGHTPPRRRGRRPGRGLRKGPSKPCESPPSVQQVPTHADDNDPYEPYRFPIEPPIKTIVVRRNQGQGRQGRFVSWFTRCLYQRRSHKKEERERDHCLELLEETQNSDDVEDEDDQDSCVDSLSSAEHSIPGLWHHLETNREDEEHSCNEETTRDRDEQDDDNSDDDEGPYMLGIAKRPSLLATPQKPVAAATLWPTILRRPMATSQTSDNHEEDADVSVLMDASSLDQDSIWRLLDSTARFMQCRRTTASGGTTVPDYCASNPPAHGGTDDLVKTPSPSSPTRRQGTRDASVIRPSTTQSTCSCSASTSGSHDEEEDRRSLSDEEEEEYDDDDLSSVDSSSTLTSQGMESAMTTCWLTQEHDETILVLQGHHGLQPRDCDDSSLDSQEQEEQVGVSVHPSPLYRVQTRSLRPIQRVSSSSHCWKVSPTPNSEPLDPYHRYFL